MSEIEIEQSFVTFYSPGTFVPETTTRPIDSWDVDSAVEMADSIKERHGALPFGFRFTTRGRAPEELDSKLTASSVFYWLGGKVRTLADVEADNLPGESILRSNMKGNDIARVITNYNSWKFTGPIGDDDIVLDYVVKADNGPDSAAPKQEE